MKRSEFELLVAKALTDIPLQFQSRLENVDVVVEDVPSKDQIASTFFGDQDYLMLKIFMKMIIKFQNPMVCLIDFQLYCLDMI